MKNIWIKDKGKELCINEEMYDVKSKRVEKDYFVFYCIKDKKETLLKKLLHNQVQANSESSPYDKKHNTSKNPLKYLFINGRETSFLAMAYIEYFTVILSVSSQETPAFPLPPPKVYYC